MDIYKDNPGPGAYDASKASDTILSRHVESRYKSPGRTRIVANGDRFDES